MAYADDYRAERAAIETYFLAAWGAGGPVGMDGHAFEPAAGSVMITIQSGAVLQGSIGRTSNRLDHVGVLIASIFTAGGVGSEAWRTHAGKIIGFLRDKTISRQGAIITTPADAFVRFSPPGIAGNQHPYISASFAVPPLLQTNVTAPFVRYSFS
jgi:hypothetical protein